MGGYLGGALQRGLFWASGFSGMEWWNGLEWNGWTGMEWNGTLVISIGGHHFIKTTF